MSEFTVAICTYRRTEVLAATLQSLTESDRPEADWELLIVDNACDPRVEAITKSFNGRLPIRLACEEEVGIARARNRAVSSTQAPIVVFADDDVLFDKRWLCAMVDAVHDQPQCMFWGGRIFPDWQVTKPPWFDVERCPMLGDSIVRYDIGAEPRIWRPEVDPEFYTCNLALRTDAIREAGMFDVTLGHKGTRRGGGEDSWMVRNISRRGGIGWYAADALLHHPVPSERLTRSHARDFAWYQGRIGIDMLRRGEGDGKTPRWLYRLALEQLCTGTGQWISGCVRRDPGLAFSGQFTTIYSVSRFWHAVFGRHKLNHA